MIKSENSRFLFETAKLVEYADGVFELVCQDTDGDWDTITDGLSFNEATRLKEILTDRGTIKKVKIS